MQSTLLCFHLVSARPCSGWSVAAWGPGGCRTAREAKKPLIFPTGSSTSQTASAFRFCFQFCRFSVQASKEAPFLKENPSSTPALPPWSCWPPLCWYILLDGKVTSHLPPRYQSFSYSAADIPAPHSKSSKKGSGKWFPKKYCNPLRTQRPD